MPGTLLLVFCRTSVEMDSVCAYLLIYLFSFFTQGPYRHLDRISPSHIFFPSGVLHAELQRQMAESPFSSFWKRIQYECFQGSLNAVYISQILLLYQSRFQTSNLVVQRFSSTFPRMPFICEVYQISLQQHLQRMSQFIGHP